MNKKQERLLEIFFRAIKGAPLSVRMLADEYQVSTKSITRDLNDLKAFLADHRDIADGVELVYDYQKRAYRLRMDSFFDEQEVLLILKLMISAKALSRSELQSLSDKLQSLSVLSSGKQAEKIFRQELLNYKQIPAQPISKELLWQLSIAIMERREIVLTLSKGEDTHLYPISLIFHVHNFYLVGRLQNDPTDPLCFYPMFDIQVVTLLGNNYTAELAEGLEEQALVDALQTALASQTIKK